MKLLITGGCGFLGSNLAAHAIKQDIELIVFDNLSRLGSFANLQWLQNLGKFRFVHGDIRNQNDITRTIAQEKPGTIFHLAGQVAMTTSISDPRKDFEINTLGTHNLLEAVRIQQPQAHILYSSTNKVYGDLEQYDYEETETRYRCCQHPNGFSETTSLEFHSPYGCSKGAADQYILDYARIFKLQTTVFRHSSMYGGRQYASYEQGWIGWFCQKALEQALGSQESFTISGNGKQVRDLLHAEDMIRLYFNAAEKPDAVNGQAFNIGGGIANSLSILELFALLQNLLGVELNYTRIAPRESDQKVFIADIAKIQNYIGWAPRITAQEGVMRMLDWVRSQQ